MTSEEAHAMVMPFGKHKNKTLGDIAAEDITYLDWLQDANIKSQRLREAVAMLGVEYAREIEIAVEDD